MGYSLPATGGAASDMLAALLSAETPIIGADTAAFGKMHICSGTVADYTLTLPAAAGNAGKLIGVRMASALTKLVTVKGNAAELIDGSNTRIMWAGEAAILLCDGAGWTKISGKTIPMVSSLGSFAAATFGVSTISKLNFDTSVYNDAPASFQDAANKRFTIGRPGLYSLTCQILLNSTNATAHYNQTYIHKNGVLYKGSYLYQLASALLSADIYSTDVFAVGDYVEMFYSYGAGTFPTSVLYVDGTSNYSQFTIREVPQW